jgi:Ku protein
VSRLGPFLASVLAAKNAQTRHDSRTTFVCEQFGKAVSVLVWLISPIALYPATRKEGLKFRLLRAKDLSPVNYKRVAEKDGKEVPWDQIVEGYQYEKDKYIVLKDEDFHRVDLEATQTVDIQDFVGQEEIDPVFFYKPYYLEPQKGAIKPTSCCAIRLKRPVKSASLRWSSCKRAGRRRLS